MKWRVIVLGVLTGFSACNCEDPDIIRVAPKIQVDVCASPEFISDCALDFGEVPISYSRPLDITILNPSSLDLIISKIDFTQDSDPAFKLPANLPTQVVSGSAGQILTITYAPQVETPVSATLRIYSDAANVGPSEPIEVKLTGSGRDLGQPDVQIEPPQCDFGDVGVGATAFCDLTLRNAGQLDLVIEGVGFEAGTDQNVYRPASVVVVGNYLPSQAGITVRIACTPTAAENYVGGLYFDTNDPDTPHSVVPLDCTGAEVPTAVARIASINSQQVSGEVLQVSPLDDVVVTGADSTPGTVGRTITTYLWTMVSKPAESTVVLTSANGVDTGFSFSSSGITRRGLDVAGTFVVRLVVTDSAGLQSTNDARVTLNAVPGEDVHIQMSWDHGSADIDLHLVRNGAAAFSRTDDCYYSNCKGPTGLDWGGGNANPHLDVDDTDGYGPENINMSGPNNGRYRVGVHYYSPHSASIPATINVKIFVRGGLRAEYTRQLTTCNQFWEVADIEWPSSLVSPVDSVRMVSDGSC
ncbi:MAG: choice-of-anchor D domain-containing protein [Pseudomonadota bacterium]